MYNILLGEEEGNKFLKYIFNADDFFSIIAVNYSARDQGVTRYMRGDEAKQKCPGIVLVKVPQLRGKADLTKYVLQVLTCLRFSTLIGFQIP